MSASEVSSVMASDDDLPKKIGIIAGGGCLPARLVESCQNQNIEPFIVAFEGQTDMDIVSGYNHMKTRLGAAGQIISTLRAHDVHDLVLIGSIRRPSLSELRPDIRTASFFTKIGLQSLGDDGLLRALRKELEAEGFTIHGVQSFAKDLLIGEGSVGKLKPKKSELSDIQKGISIALKLGEADIGHSVVVQQGLVLAVEAIEGTDDTIKRAASYSRKGKGGVLVKWCKPDQDTDLDLPAIGPETIRNCAQSGLSGIAVKAQQTLILQSEEVISLLNKNKMFLVGFSSDDVV